MPEIKNTFVKGKMNKDLDERLIEKGTYREAQNIAISESSDSDTGASETITGNIKKGTDPFQAGEGDDGLGKVDDIKNKRIFYFVTNFGVWSLGSYGYSLNGLILCYMLALPFLGYSLVSTLI